MVVSMQMEIANPCSDGTIQSYNDIDNDGVCDADEVEGCQDSSACNFDANATDAGNCIFEETNFDCAGNGSLETKSALQTAVDLWVNDNS